MQTPVAMAPWRLKSLSLCQPVPTPTSTTLTSTFPPLQPTFRAPLEEQSRALGGARPPGDALPPAKASPAAGCPGSGEEALKLDPAWGYDNGGTEGGALVEGGESGRKDEGVRLGGGEGMPRGRERERVGEGEGRAVVVVGGR